MNLASRSLYRTGLLVTLAAAVFAFGCAKKKVAPPPPPPPPPPAAARPTVTLQASPSSINKGESATLSWNSTDATHLSIAPEIYTLSLHDDLHDYCHGSGRLHQCHCNRLREC